MNGYYARVQRHRLQLAEAAARGEKTAVPNFDWLTAAVEAIADAAHAPKRPGHPAEDDERPKTA